MELVCKKNQYRRDCEANVRCEKCGNEEKISAYDDDNFWKNVLPNRPCSKCGESTISQGLTPKRVITKYTPDEVV